MTKHIRKRGHGIDKRFRTSWAANKLTPVLCGGEPGAKDISKADARHIQMCAVARPDWLSDICPACLEVLNKNVDA